MYIIIFFVVFAVTQFTTNRILKVNDENKISYSYSKRDGLIIFGLLVVGVLLQVFVKLQGKAFLIICGTYGLAILLTMVILATMKRAVVEKQKEEMKKIFDVLVPVLPTLPIFRHLLTSILIF